MLNNSKIKVIGAGPSSSILAIALSRLSNKIDLFDPLSLEELINIDRTYAITQSSRKVFHSIGLWNEVEKLSCSFDSLVVHDKSIDRSITFDINDLTKDNCESSSIGWIIEHRLLMKIIMRQIVENPNILFHQQSTSILDSDKYDFTFASDGKFSQSRNYLKIPSFSFRYNQACLTFKILARFTTPKTAYEVFRKDGPLAILPVRNDLYQVIWSAPKDVCLDRISMTRSFFLDQLAVAMPFDIQPDCLIDQPKLCDIDFLFSFRFHVLSKTLFGESIHSLHPVGGQGLNLSIRDVKELYELFNKLSPREKLDLPAIFESNRRLDIFITSILTDSLVRIFSSKNSILLLFRRLLFALLLSNKLFRRFILLLMTDGISGFKANI